MHSSKLTRAAALAATPIVAHAEGERRAPSVIVVTATTDKEEAAEQIENTPGSIESMSADEFGNMQSQRIKDLLAYAPGETVQPRMEMVNPGTGRSLFAGLRFAL